VEMWEYETYDVCQKESKRVKKKVTYLDEFLDLRAFVK
jgi:hypothetical protein